MNVKMAHQKIIYQLTEKRIPAASGIGIVGDILERAGFSEEFRDVKLAEKRSRKQIDAGAVMTTFIALLCMGKPDFEYVSELQNDAAYYQNALHLNKGLPSPATLRQRMDEIGSKLRNGFVLSFKTSFILLVMLLSTQDNYFFPSAAVMLGLTVFLLSRGNSASLEFHGFRYLSISFNTSCAAYSRGIRKFLIQLFNITWIRNFYHAIAAAIFASWST